MISLRICLALLSLLLIDECYGQIQCKNMDGLNVDWFVFYKLPKNAKSDDVLIQNGTGFMYLDSRVKKWEYPRGISIMDTNHAVAITIQQMYNTQNNANVLNIMYNDEHPDNQTSFDLGHTKGVVSFDAISGFWMLHSAPKFPALNSYFYPPNAHYFGQMGICVSLSSASIGDVANQLFFTQPYIYMFNLPTNFAAAYPRLTDVKNGKYQNVAPYTSKKTLTSLGGQQFLHFGKAKGFNNDLYSGFIAPTLQTDLFTETWQHEPGNLMDYCTPSIEVLDIKEVKMPFNISFSNWNDHSKYAIATNQGPKGITPPPYVCIGDINRQQHQLVRGGGSMCIRDTTLFATFTSMVGDFYACKKNVEAKPQLRSNRVHL